MVRPSMQETARSAFITASQEEKIKSREELMARNSQPLVDVPPVPTDVAVTKKK